MVYSLVLLTLVFIGLLVGSITDLRTREVPDWLSYGMMGTGIGLGLLFTVLHGDSLFIVYSLFGLGVMFLFGLVMFYSGQWGGGDSKILMGVGALAGLSWKLLPFPFLLAFFVNMLVMGAIYGIAWSLYLVAKHYSAFKASLSGILKLKSAKQGKRILLMLGAGVVIAFFLVGRFVGYMLIVGYGFVWFIAALMVWVKALEKSCMIRSVKPSQLSEGDWIVQEVRYRGKYICGPKDLGIEKAAIKQLIGLYKQKKIKEIVIKEGIPFVPSFLLAFIVTMFFGNVFFLLL